MKRVVLIATLLVCITGLYAQKKFYYGYTQKIFLEETSYAVVMNEGQNNSFLSQSPGIKVVSNNNAYTIVEYIERDSLKGSVFPVYKTQDGVLLGCTDELVFSLKKGVDVSSILKQYPIEVLMEKPFYVLAKIKNAEQNDVLSIANRIMESGLVNYSHPNFIAKVQRLTDPIGDPYFSYQFYLHSYGQLINDGHYATPDADINALEAWEVTKGNSSIKVAVIDEGVTNNHPDIPSVKQIRLQGSNFAAPYDGTDSDDPSPVSDDNHGNACSGIICAEHNNEGIAGIAPNCKIMPIRIPYGYIPATVYADAIDFAVNNGADIISNSWGYVSSNTFYPVIVDAIKNATVYGRNNKGCVVSFAAGNTANRVSLNNGFVTFPANCGNDTMIVVGASERTNNVANYSPSDNRISVVAPSHKAYSSQIQGEDLEVWSIDIPGQSGYNPDPYSGVFLPNSGTNYLAYTGRFGGTSAACPQVAGVAALILSVNSNLSAVDVKKIIESTTKKIGSKTYQNSSSHPNGTWNDEMGYGLVNAYAAVCEAQKSDLYIRDTVTDDGTMPSSCYSTWDSPDIWVETLDGDYVAYPHGNTKYAVCVKIHNRRDVASSGTERLFLNWAKAGFNDSWDEYWTGNNPLPCGAPKGGVIGSANGRIIPSIPANSYRIDTIHWITPAGVDYANCTDFNYNKWHFCLLARIHDDDVIAHENEHDADVHQLVKNHNNVAQQNVYLDSAENYRKTLGIGNVHTIDMSRIINLSPKVIGNISITDYAEVYITLDAGLLAAINSANISGLTWVNSNTLRWNGGNASIPVTLPANSYYTLQTTVHFLADQIPDENIFDFDIVLRSANGDSILGGEHYKCVRTAGRYFQAVANDGNDNLFPGIGEQAELTAEDILESADYRWFDDQGNEVGNGLSCNVNPQQTTTYTLRVTADADGYRSYDQVTVNVAMMRISSISPNPTEGQVRIGYALSRDVSAATLQILNGSGQVVYTQALSGGNGSKVTGEDIVNTSYLAAGSYTVRLVSSNGKVHDSKTLVVR